MVQRVRIRDYRSADEASWLRCRVLGFLGTSYFDDVVTSRPSSERESGRESVQLVAVVDRPPGVRTPGADQVVGLLDLELWSDDEGRSVATIDTVAVHPDHQGVGIADALLEVGLERLRTSGVELLDAWTREDEAANRWYVRQGFTIATEYLHVYVDADENGEFRGPPPLAAPVKAFHHAPLAEEDRLRERFRRVHRCRRYVRPVVIERWPDDETAVAGYDEENGDREDLRFIADLAERLGARRVSDVGCGTGLLACDLASRGMQVTGVDPGRAILELARRRPGSGAVRWIQGTAADLPAADADLVVLSAHVANYLPTRQAWRQLLADLGRTLIGRGHLVLDSWNPRAEVWRDWPGVMASHVGRDGDAVETHGEELPGGRRVQETLRHWDPDFLVQSLAEAGFEVLEQWGGYDGSTFAADGSRQLVVLARRV